MKFQLPTIQLAVIAGITVTSLSHLGEVITWSVLVGLAIALLRYGINKTDSDSNTFDYFPEEEQEPSEPTPQEPIPAVADLTELQEDLWQEVEAMDERGSGTTPEVQTDAVDADIVEPMPNPMQKAKDKAAARWGYRGRNIKPPVPAANDTEIGLMTARLKLVIPKETGKARQTWAALCKQLKISGYTSKKDAKPSVKALWLSQQGVSFQNVVKASLKLAA